MKIEVGLRNFKVLARNEIKLARLKSRQANFIGLRNTNNRKYFLRNVL